MPELHKTHLATWIRDLEPKQFLLGNPVQNTGISLAVVQDAQVTFKAAFGLSDRATQEPVTPETVFPVASITKSFSAAAPHSL